MKNTLVAIGFIAVVVLVVGFLGRERNLLVARVIDGDTVVLSDGRHVRLIGIDAPEEGECYANEATADAEHLLLNQPVRVKTDVNELDQFGRTLAYVFLMDGSMVNRELLDQGSGMFFYDSVNLSYQQELIDAAESARTGARELWNA